MPKVSAIIPFDKEATLPLWGLLVLLVVCGHLCSVIGRGFSWASPAVAVFFFLSGYGLMKKRQNAGGVALKGGLARAAAKLLPTFFLASLAYYAYLKLTGRTIDLFSNIIHGSSSLPIPFTWYIPAIMALYAIFYCSDRLFRRDSQFCCAIVVGVALYWVLTALVFGWPFYWWKTIGGFVAGVFFSAQEEKVRSAMSNHPIRCYGVVAVGLAFVVLLQHLENFPIRFAADHLFFALIGPAVALVLYKFRLPRVGLAWLGAISYEIYVVHGIFVTELNACLGNGAFYFITALTCSVLCGWALNWINRLMRIRMEKTKGTTS